VWSGLKDRGKNIFLPPSAPHVWDLPRAPPRPHSPVPLTIKNSYINFPFPLHSFPPIPFLSPPKTQPSITFLFNLYHVTILLTNHQSTPFPSLPLQLLSHQINSIQFNQTNPRSSASHRDREAPVTFRASVRNVKLEVEVERGQRTAACKGSRPCR
jgi:hypothetical protein